MIGAGSGSTKIEGVSAGRFVLKGTIDGREAFFETQKIAGSSATETSYEGPLKEGFGKPQWLKSGKAFGYDNGDALDIHEGPLDGQWTFACR